MKPELHQPAKKQYDALKKSSDLLWQQRGRAHTTASFFGRNEHLHDMKTPPLGKEKKKKREKRMNPHVTDLQDPRVEAQRSALPGG